MRLENPLETNIASILVFGPQILALTEDGTRLVVWDEKEEAVKSIIAFENGFTASMILHPATYLNKVLVASQEGAMQLWNIKTSYVFSSQTLQYLTTPAGNASSPSSLLCSDQNSMHGIPVRQHAEVWKILKVSGTITCFAQAAIDVIGIGFSTGEVVLHDIASNERIARFFMDGGAVRSLAFRAGEKVLATASASGAIAFWDLEEQALLHLLRGAHEGSVTHVEWIPGHAVLVSSGSDNAVKVRSSPAGRRHSLTSAAMDNGLGHGGPEAAQVPRGTHERAERVAVLRRGRQDAAERGADGPRCAHDERRARRALRRALAGRRQERQGMHAFVCVCWLIGCRRPRWACRRARSSSRR